MLSGTQGYAEAAPMLLRTRLSFEEVHAPILHLIPRQPSCVLDIGSGPGHDAARLAEMGHAVMAAEPTPELLRGAIDLHGTDRVRWLEDGLPDLPAVSALGLRFSLVLLSGVWMHLDEAQRRKAMPTIAGLLEPQGVIALSLRHGRVPPGRRMFDVSPSETVKLATEAGLDTILEAGRDSVQAGNRAAGVTWTFLAFSSPPESRPEPRTS